MSVDDSEPGDLSDSLEYQLDISRLFVLRQPTIKCVPQFVFFKRAQPDTDTDSARQPDRLVEICTGEGRFTYSSDSSLSLSGLCSRSMVGDPMLYSQMSQSTVKQVKSTQR